MEINLISDTVTIPSSAMLAYMMEAKVGDDVFREDPTVIQLEKIVADLFGKEAALFFPSGTMANQVAINIHTRPGEQLICDHFSHIHQSELGGIAFHSGVTTQLIQGKRGMITAEQVEKAINLPSNFVAPITSLVCIENTTNRGGGACYDLEDLRAIKEVCETHQLAMHLDGARIWNALVAKKQQPKEFGDLFDSISVCFSKGLGAPIGSVLIGSQSFINKALTVRKRMGGGMRQVGYLASACLYALQNNVKRLKEDHQRAEELAQALSRIPWVEKVEPTETNIVLFYPLKNYSLNEIIALFREANIHISSLGNEVLRMVTHKDYTEEMHLYTLSFLQQTEW